MRDLISQHYLQFYPQYEHSGVGFSNEDFKLAGFREWYVSKSRDPYEATLGNAIHPAIVELNFYADRYEASVMGDETYEHWLCQVIRYAAEFGRSPDLPLVVDSVDQMNRKAITRLGTLQMPHLGELSIDDLVAVRTKAEGFEQWRQQLFTGLTRIEGETVDPVKLKRAVRESLAIGKDALQKEIDKSSSLSKMKAPVFEFGVGAIVGVVIGGITGGPAGFVTGPLFGGGITATAKYVRDVLIDRKPRAGRLALAKHYVIFD